MVKIGPRLPRPSRREIEKREKEQRRATQIENAEGTLVTEPCELLEPAMQRKRARHRDIDDADLEDSKRQREKTLKRRAARRLAKQAERELARREGSLGWVEDSLEFLLAELDRHYNDHGHQPSETPITRSEPLPNGFNNAGDFSVLLPTDQPMEVMATSLHLSPTTESDIDLPLVSPNESTMTVDPIANPENPLQMQSTKPLEHPRTAPFATPAGVPSEEPHSVLATSNNSQLPPHQSQNAVGAAGAPPTVYHSQQDTINQLPVLQLPESLPQSFSSFPSGKIRSTEVPSSLLSDPGTDSSVNPSTPSESLNTSNFSSSGPASAILNLQETPRVSLLGDVCILPNDGLGPTTLASLASQPSSSSIPLSVSGSSLTRASHIDLGSTTDAGPSISAIPTELSVPSDRLPDSILLSIPVIPANAPTTGSLSGVNIATSLVRADSLQFSFAPPILGAATRPTRTRSTTLTSPTSGMAQEPLATVSSRARAFSSPTVNTSGVVRVSGKLPTTTGIALSSTNEVDDAQSLAPESNVQVGLCWANIPEFNLSSDANSGVFGASITRQRVRSDTFSSNISDSANVETTALDGRIAASDNDRGAGEDFQQKELFPCNKDSSGIGSQSVTTPLAPAASIVDGVKRLPMLPPVPESTSDYLSNLPRMTAMDNPHTPFSEPTYPDTPCPRSGLIPPYSTPTSQSPRIFTLELHSPRKTGKATHILPIHNPHLSRPEEKSGSSIVYAFKWVLRKTLEYFFQGRG